MITLKHCNLFLYIYFIFFNIICVIVYVRYGVQLRKPIQKEVIEKPNLQTLDEQNALQTTSGECGDGVGNNPPIDDPNVNEFNCKQQLKQNTKKQQQN